MLELSIKCKVIKSKRAACARTHRFWILLLFDLKSGPEITVHLGFQERADWTLCRDLIALISHTEKLSGPGHLHQMTQLHTAFPPPAGLQAEESKTLQKGAHNPNISKKDNLKNLPHLQHQTVSWWQSLSDPPARSFWLSACLSSGLQPVWK